MPSTVSGCGPRSLLPGEDFAAWVAAYTEPMTVGPETVRRIGIVVLCALCDLAVGLVLVGIDLEDSPVAGTPEFSAYVAIMALFGVVGWPLLFAGLRHAPEEDSAHPGPRSALVCSVLVILGSFSYFGAASAAVAFISLVGRGSTRWSVVGVIAMVGGVLVDWAFNPSGAPPLDDFYFLATFAGLMVPMLLVGMGRAASKRDQRARVAAAATAERERLSRDLHDSLSHRLSLISLYAGALAEREDLSPEQQRRSAETIRAEAAHAVDDLRQVLRSITSRQAPGPGVREIISSAQEAGDAITFTSDGATPRLSTAAAQALARALQECLTNARKHAPGQPVTVVEATEPQAGTYTCHVSNPILAGVAGKGTGRGLEGMRQRLKLVGGTLAIDQGREFRVRITLPLKEAQ